MSTHENAEALVGWVRQRLSATVSDIAAAGLIKSRTAYDAVQYMRFDTERLSALSAAVRARNRVHYRATGAALPIPRAQSAPSFGGLLEAWGIAREPVSLPMLDARRHQISDHE